MRHGDSKTNFSTGAQRDTGEGKGTPSLISPVLIHRLGVLLQKGAEHYGADNWLKGMTYRRTADSMIRHIFQWLAGDTEEDHLAAVCFGAMCLMTYEEVENRIPRDPKHNSLDDRDEGLKKILDSILTPAPKDATLKVTSIHKSVDDFVEGKEPRMTTCIKGCGGSTINSSGICFSCQIAIDGANQV